MSLCDLSGGQAESVSSSSIAAFKTLIRGMSRESDVQLISASCTGASNTLSQEHLLDFWSRQYRKSAPYLLSDEQRRIEEKLLLDSRSTHFVAVREGEIQAAMRVTPMPFELGELSPELAPLMPRFHGFVEFSRLICDSDARGTLLSTRLMGEACIWAMAHGYAGLIGLCRPSPRRLFERYGLSPYLNRSFTLSMRENGAYFLMVGQWPRILDSALRHFQQQQQREAPRPALQAVN